MKCKNIEASVLVNGVSLQEYKPEIRNNESVAESWIIGEPDTTYQVLVRTRKLATESVSVRMYVDGRKDRLAAYVMRSNEKTRIIGPKVNNGTAQRPMKFGAIVYSTEDISIIGQGNDDQNLAELSSIRLEIWRCRIGRYTDAGRPTKDFVEHTPVISEKATKKSGRFCDTVTKFGESIPINSERLVRTTRLDKVPLAVFKFFYGSRGVLESQDVIPVEQHQPQQAANAANDNIELDVK
ncbi:hypothetical protein DFS34DRAFT_398632 [Phlyctochytrium arcticum]|nr:hypothetical protein DFS34DRAFT_398632 [Phlyctochytrium arcticum]